MCCLFILEDEVIIIISIFYLQSWTGAVSVPSAIVAMLLRLPNLKFAIVTLGEDGCIMIDRRTEIGMPLFVVSKLSKLSDSLFIFTISY